MNIVDILLKSTGIEPETHCTVEEHHAIAGYYVATISGMDTHTGLKVVIYTEKLFKGTTAIAEESVIIHNNKTVPLTVEELRKYI